MRKKRLIGWGVFLIIGLVFPMILPNTYYEQILDNVAIFAVAALGLNFIYGYTGYISFAQAGFFGIGAYVTAILTVQDHLSFWLTLPLSGVVAAIFGAILGIPALRLKGHYLAMATIGFGVILQMVMTNWTTMTNGAQGISGIPSPNFLGISINGAVSFYYLAAIVLAILAFVSQRIQFSQLGRSFLAIREDEIAAGSVGINLTRSKVTAFAISAAYGGFAGCLYAVNASYVSPDTFSFDQSIVFFTMVLIGGAGTVSGPITGALLLTFLPELLRFLKDSYIAVYGLGIVLIMLFMPQGIIPLLAQKLRDRRAHRDKVSEEVAL